MAGAEKRRVLLGLIGSPIKSSASPAMHEAAARAAELDAFYHLIDVPGADREALRLMLEGVGGSASPASMSPSPTRKPWCRSSTRLRRRPRRSAP